MRSNNQDAYIRNLIDRALEAAKEKEIDKARATIELAIAKAISFDRDSRT